MKKYLGILKTETETFTGIDIRIISKFSNSKAQIEQWKKLYPNSKCIILDNNELLNNFFEDFEDFMKVNWQGGIIYFVPLVALAICLAINSLLVGPIILLILGTSIFITTKVIIPVSESKHLQMYEKYYGKDLVECKALIEEQQKGSK